MRLLIAAEVPGDDLAIKDVEDSRALLRDLLVEHTLPCHNGAEFTPKKSTFCPECERLWSAYAYTREELSKLFISAELSGDHLAIKDMEESHSFVHGILIEHACQRTHGTGRLEFGVDV